MLYSAIRPCRKIFALGFFYDDRMSETGLEPNPGLPFSEHSITGNYWQHLISIWDSRIMRLKRPKSVIYCPVYADWGTGYCLYRRQKISGGTLGPPPPPYDQAIT